MAHSKNMATFEINRQMSTNQRNTFFVGSCGTRSDLEGHCFLQCHSSRPSETRTLRESRFSCYFARPLDILLMRQLQLRAMKVGTCVIFVPLTFESPDELTREGPHKNQSIPKEPNEPFRNVARLETMSAHLVERERQTCPLTSGMCKERTSYR